jgi:hypothetical protein
MVSEKKSSNDILPRWGSPIVDVLDSRAMTLTIPFRSSGAIDSRIFPFPNS